MKHCLVICFAASMFLGACKKEKTYLYDVNGVEVKQPGSDKPNIKSTNEFVSIAFSDLFGRTINQDTLLSITLAYTAFGDKELIEDMIIRNYLKWPGLQIPSKSEMKTDAGKFVNDTYKKFLNRLPNEYEQWHLTNLINSDTTVTPDLFYYSIMTSDEYRYY